METNIFLKKELQDLQKIIKKKAAEKENLSGFQNYSEQVSLGYILERLGAVYFAIQDFKNEEILTTEKKEKLFSDIEKVVKHFNYKIRSSNSDFERDQLYENIHIMEKIKLALEGEIFENIN